MHWAPGTYISSGFISVTIFIIHSQIIIYITYEIWRSVQFVHYLLVSLLLLGSINFFIFLHDSWHFVDTRTTWGASKFSLMELEKKKKNSLVVVCCCSCWCWCCCCRSYWFFSGWYLVIFIFSYSSFFLGVIYDSVAAGICRRRLLGRWMGESGQHDWWLRRNSDSRVYQLVGREHRLRLDGAAAAIDRWHNRPYQTSVITQPGQ